MLNAIEVTIPNGDITRCFDSRGAEYQVPSYVAANPRNLLPEPVPVDESEDEDSEAAQMRREAKGKGVEDPADLTTVSILRSDTDKRQIVNVSKKDSCRLILKKTLEQSHFPPEYDNIRMFYQGREITREGAKLFEDLGAKEGVLLQLYLMKHPGPTKASRTIAGNLAVGGVPSESPL